MTEGPRLSDDDLEAMTRKMFRPDDMGRVMEKAIAEENSRLTDEQAWYEEALARRQAFAKRKSHLVRNMMDAAWCGTTLTPRR